jgi:hypothetical protein
MGAVSGEITVGMEFQMALCPSRYAVFLSVWAERGTFVRENFEYVTLRSYQARPHTDDTACQANFGVDKRKNSGIFSSNRSSNWTGCWFWRGIRETHLTGHIVRLLLEADPLWWSGSTREYLR